MNKTLLVLIPKQKGNSVLSHFKPISLCNVAYKVCSKVLVNMLKDLISPNQNAFVKGRAISDNILLVDEILSTIKRRKSGKGALAGMKLDMSKAYDGISWNFIEAVMVKMNFPQHWNQLIVLARSVSSWLLMEAYRMSGIQVEEYSRVILSHRIFFILCQNILSLMLLKA